MKNILILLSIVVFCSCSKTENNLNKPVSKYFDSIESSDHISPENTGEIHDEMAIQLCDLIAIWKKGDRENPKASIFSEILVKEQARLTGYSESFIIDYYEDVYKLNASNANTWILPELESNFENNLYDEIMLLVEEWESDELFSQNLSDLLVKYSEDLSEAEITVIEEVSNSSYSYWKENYDNCISDLVVLRAHPWAKAVIGGDIKGAIGGAIGGGITGGPIGAVAGGTLGANAGTLLSIGECIFFGC